MSDVISGRVPYTDSLKGKLYEQYSDVFKMDIEENRDWLLYGEGEMINEPQKTKNHLGIVLLFQEKYLSN